MGRTIRAEGMYVPIVEAWAKNPGEQHGKPVSCILVNAVQQMDSLITPDGVELIIPGMKEKLYLSTGEAKALISALKRALKQAAALDPLEEKSSVGSFPREWSA